MAKGLPYFQFSPSEYMTGDITLCTFSAQGLYLNICCIYWQREGNLPIAKLRQRYSHAIAELDELIEEGIVKLCAENQKVIINFLDEQIQTLSTRHQRLSEAGKKGAKARYSQASGTPIATRIEENRIEKEKVKKEKEPSKARPTTLEDVIAYMKERGFNNPVVTANKWMDHYTANGWKVGRNTMKDWKASVRTWEREEKSLVSNPNQKTKTYKKLG